MSEVKSPDETPTAAGPLRDRDVDRLRAAARAVSDEDVFGGAFELVREAGVADVKRAEQRRTRMRPPPTAAASPT